MPKIKLTHNDFFKLSPLISWILAKKFKGVEFNYALSKNVRLLKPEIDSIEATRVSTLGEYEKERLGLCKRFADRDDKEKPITKNNAYIMNEKSRELFEKEMKPITEVNKDKLDEYEKFLEKEVELDIHLLNLKDIPIEASEFINMLFPLIKE